MSMMEQRSERFMDMLRKLDANDVLLGIRICTGYKQQYDGTIVEIERSTSPSIPADVDHFTLVVEPPDCQCQPRCRIDIIALHYNGICSFLSELYYDRIEAVISNIRSKANANSDTEQQ